VATAAAGTPHEKLEAALIEAVDRALSGELKEAQIERARKAALIEYYSNVQNLGTRADRLASAVLFTRDGQTFGQERERLERVAFANVMNTARKLLIPERRAILSLVPLRSAS
jgi:predicted Zn-dependent peptidase